MKRFHLIPVLLMVMLSLLFISVLVAAPQKTNTNKEKPKSASVKNSKTAPTQSTVSTLTKKTDTSQLIVYYFYGKQRCSTCQTIEKYAKEAVTEGFPAEIKSKKIVFVPVNVEDANNLHFIKDYQLVSRTVVVSRTVNGKEIKWKNLDKVWELVRNKEKYFSYIQTEVKAMSEGK